jgi:SOS-response transcriptional repressor LexA
LEVDYIGVIVGPDLVVRNGTVTTLPSERASTDKSIHGWKALVKEAPTNANTRLDAIIKNTYRTLMTRGQKGCYVYFVDDETRRFFADRIVPVRKQIPITVSVSEANQETVILPFRRLQPKEVKPFENCVPLYDLKAAAGQFSDEQQNSDIDWVELPDVFRPRQGLFVIQVDGESMNRRIPSGSWCLFKEIPAGSRQGKVVLVRHREISDTDTGGHYTVKIYDSRKKMLEDGTWWHTSIILRPETTISGYFPIVLDESQSEELEVIGEFVAVLG